jgi:hypothetical protein
MNTDKDKNDDSRSKYWGAVSKELRKLVSPQILLGSIIFISVFIRVHPWFQRFYPTDAS